VCIHLRWSEVPLTAAGLAAALKPLDFDALHLHAAALSLQAAAEEGKRLQGSQGLQVKRLLSSYLIRGCR
jgi:hypothetical protein